MRSRNLTAALVTAALIGTLALAGCGTTDAAATAPKAAPTGPANAPITLTDGTGNTVTLADGPADRVVALEWAQAEYVQALGAELVGISDPAGYQSWVGFGVPLLGDPTDVGKRREPSIETLAELEPDLIIGVARSIPDEARTQIERIAPVLLLQGPTAADPIGRMTEDFRTVATALGKEDAADNVIANLTATLEQNAAEITAAGLTGVPVVLASFFNDGASVSIRMHGPGSAAQQVAEQMGLSAAWTDPGDEAFGLSNTDLEGLTTLPGDARLLYWGNDQSEDVVTGTLADNAVWTSLPLVNDDHVYRAAAGIWVYGGPASLAAWSDELVTQLTGK